MIIFSKETVLEAAKKRIRYLFEEFDEVIVSFSGGKDSTVCLNLCLEIAEEKNKFPLKVMFLDQEAEWTLVIDYVKRVMYDSRVDPLWMQIPVKIFNATSPTDKWLHCWDPEAKDKWIHPQDPISKKINHYKCDRFKDLINKISLVDYPDKRVAFVGGVRCEESPARRVGLTGRVSYKWITWGKNLKSKSGHVVFYPLYDWSYSDIWKAIHSNNWDYCEIYDYMYNFGIPVMKMRVSNVHHETATASLLMLQEIDPKVWNRLTDRLSGINTLRTLNKDTMQCPDELPYMFSSWREYRDYLLENLIPENDREVYRNKFDNMDKKMNYLDEDGKLSLVKIGIRTILLNDYYFTFLANFQSEPKYWGQKPGRSIRG